MAGLGVSPLRQFSGASRLDKAGAGRCLEKVASARPERPTMASEAAKVRLWLRATVEKDAEILQHYL